MQDLYDLYDLCDLDRSLSDEWIIRLNSTTTTAFCDFHPRLFLVATSTTTACRDRRPRLSLFLQKARA